MSALETATVPDDLRDFRDVIRHPISHADLMAMHDNDERLPIAGLEQGTDMLTQVLRDALG